jgi:glycosyltransferase involved in cell wall biosynthesis
MTKIALVVPAPRWSMNFVAEGFKRYVKRSKYTFDIVGIWGPLPESLIEYDWIITFNLWWQKHYEGRVFEAVKDRFMAILTGLFCYNRITDWSVFQHVFAVSDAVILKDRLNVEYTVMPFGVDTDIFKPMKIPKKHFTAFIGNAKGRPTQKRVYDWLVPICNAANVDYYIHDPIRGDAKFLTLREIAWKYNELEAYLMTSSWDGAPRGLLEAAACGLPLLSTRTGYAVHGLVQGGVNGWICDTKMQFINRVKKLRDNPELGVTMGKQSVEIIKKDWDWRVVAERWMKRIEEIW